VRAKGELVVERQPAREAAQRRELLDDLAVGARGRPVAGSIACRWRL
jgi:hypothetical protein